MRVTVLPDSSSPDGGHKVKLAGVIVVEGLFQAYGGPAAMHPCLLALTTSSYWQCTGLESGKARAGMGREAALVCSTALACAQLRSRGRAPQARVGVAGHVQDITPCCELTARGGYFCARAHPQLASLACPAAGSDLDVMANLGSTEVAPLEKQRRRLAARVPGGRGGQRVDSSLQHGS